MTTPVYAPAAWLAAGDTVPPTHTKSAPAPLKAEAVAPADGVKLVQPVVVLVPLVQPVQVPIGRLLAPLVRFSAASCQTTW